MTDVLLEIESLRKEYGALRPLRLQELRMRRGAVVALLGLDAAAAEMLVNLVTGATLPDQGVIRVFGRDTAAITDGDDWLRTLDRFGIVSDRAVLLDDLTVAQNLAMTFTLEIDPIAFEVSGRVAALAAEAGLPDAGHRKAATLTPAEKLRVRLGRAIALEPALLMMEHPTATLPPDDVAAFADDIRRLAAARTLTVLGLTADAAFASAVTTEVLRLQPATGALVPETRAWQKVRRLFRGPGS